MMINIDNGQVIVTIPEETVANLLQFSTSSGETLGRVFGRLAAQTDQRITSTRPESVLTPVYNKRSCEVLGTRVTANSLGQLFANVVDAVHGMDPEAIEKLARTRARTRRYVTRSHDAVHEESPHLPTVRTCSGWYVSDNVGTRDVCRALTKLCEAAGLKYGTDVVFPV